MRRHDAAAEYRASGRRRLRREFAHEPHRSRSRRRGVLAGDERAVRGDVDPPILRPLELGSALAQLGLEQEGHDLGQLDRRLLAIGPAREPTVLNQKIALGSLTSSSAAGAWQTIAIVLPAARKLSSNVIDALLSGISHIGPWPPG